MQDFYRCVEGQEALVNQVAHTACYKLMMDVHYEARVQAIVSYCADYEKCSIKKEEARNFFLTREQYLKVNKYHLYSFLLNLILQYAIHFITFRCLQTGAPARAHDRL